MRISDWSSDVCSSDLYQEAEPLARHLTIKYPHDVFGWRALGWALRELGREDEALTPWFEALACSPQTASVHYGLGATLERKSQEVGAESCFRRALMLDAGYAFAWNSLGERLFDQEKILTAKI